MIIMTCFIGGWDTSLNKVRELIIEVSFDSGQKIACNPPTRDFLSYLAYARKITASDENKNHRI